MTNKQSNTRANKKQVDKRGKKRGRIERERANKTTRVKWGEENKRQMENNEMREIGIVMGTWYVEFCADSPATAPEMAYCRESNLDLRKPPRQRRQKNFLLPLEHCVGFARRGEDDAAK